MIRRFAVFETVVITLVLIWILYKMATGAAKVVVEEGTLTKGIAPPCVTPKTMEGTEGGLMNKELIVLSGILALALSACGGGDEGESGERLCAVQVLNRLETSAALHDTSHVVCPKER